MNNAQIQISAVVLAKNEEFRIARCLESLRFCDELIVIDNGSTDDTVKIAKTYGALVKRVEETNFSHLRTIGKEMAKGKWILYVDADEEIPEPLQKEIFQIVRKNDQSSAGYYVLRENYYLGTLWPVQDRMQRFFLKEKLIRWEGIVHETAVVDGDMGALVSPLIHHTHRTLEEMLNKTNEWSNYEAQLRLNANHPPVVWWRLIRVMSTGFLRSFIQEGGWRVGTVGWIESIYQGFSMFITYAKLWELQGQKTENRRQRAED